MKKTALTLMATVVLIAGTISPALAARVTIINNLPTVRPEFTCNAWFVYNFLGFLPGVRGETPYAATGGGKEWRDVWGSVAWMYVGCWGIRLKYKEFSPAVSGNITVTVNGFADQYVTIEEK